MGSNQSNGDKGKNSLNRTVTTRLVTVKIPINSSYWEKVYNIEAALEQVAIDFRKDNDIDAIQENYYIDWKYKDNSINMDSKKKLKYFIAEDNSNDSPTIEITQEIKLKPGKEDKIILEINELVGKPFFNPFEISIFQTKQQAIKIKTYNKKLISQTQLDKFCVESAYCNGNNHLYISGGVNPATKNAIDLFWDIDLKEDNLDNPIQIIPKKNHSMICCDKKVYIVGGQDKNTLFYDCDTKSITNWASLNLERFEPSLIKHDNYLFCFDTFKKKNESKFSIEKINLGKLDEAKWELINPEISPQLGNNVYSQKFFGVVEDYGQNIIFLGGIYYEDENINNKNMCTKYNIYRNTMEKSNILFEETSFNEKTFLPLNAKTYFILPNFQRRAPKIAYFNKEKNSFKISPYVSNHTFEKKKKSSNIKFSTQLKSSLNQLNFDMPGLYKEIELNPRKADKMLNGETNNNLETKDFKTDINEEKKDELETEKRKLNEKEEGLDKKSINSISKVEANIKVDILQDGNNTAKSTNNRKFLYKINSTYINSDYAAFHNSVNDPCSLFTNKIKVRSVSTPKNNFSIKTIKQQANVIIDSNRERIRINNY